MNEMLTPTEIAKRLKLHPNTVRDYLKSGTIIGMKFGKVWRIEEFELERFLRDHKNRN